MSTTACARPPSPPRSTNPTALWAHLISRTATTAVNPTANKTSAAPIAPIDKSGTTMRLLLHDTQAHLERFSMRVDRLLEDVGIAKKEVKEVGKAFEEGRERTEIEYVELVNRCQTQLQKSMGEPAQVAALSAVQASVLATDRRVESIDKQLGALHSGIEKQMGTLHLVIQTQSKQIELLSQATQTHSQALQALQEQQSQILTALLPLLGSVPQHIAETSIRAVIGEIGRVVHAPFESRSTSSTSSDRTESSSANTATTATFPPPTPTRKRQHMSSSGDNDTIPLFVRKRSRRSMVEDDRHQEQETDPSPLNAARNDASSQSQSFSRPRSQPNASEAQVASSTIKTHQARRPLADINVLHPSPTPLSKQATTSVARMPSASHDASAKPRNPTLSTPGFSPDFSTSAVATTSAHYPLPFAFVPANKLPAAQDQNQRAPSSKPIPKPRNIQKLQDPASNNIPLHSPTLAPDHAAVTSSPVMPPRKPLSATEARALFREEGKRFIPLDDDEDEDEEDEEEEGTE